MSLRSHRAHAACVVGLAVIAAIGCETSDKDPKLSKLAGNDAIPDVPVPPESNPPLASIADMTPVLERPARDAKAIGYLHAGGRVARAAEPYSKEGCAGGWYPVRPAGFICAGDSATTDLSHPTLAAMAIQPMLEQALPYTYARTRTPTALYERDLKREAAVREVGKLRKRAGMAVVGSWMAQTPEGAVERLALLTSGKFVKASDLEAADADEFSGAVLNKDLSLPVAWVVKRGVRAFELDGRAAQKDEQLEPHTRLDLTGRYRTVEGEKFWALRDGRWVRHRDVTVVLARSTFPDFVKEGVKWLDVSTITSVLVAYEGKQPIFATLVSVARPPRPDAIAAAPGGDIVPASLQTGGQAQPPAKHALGTFEVTAKHVTLVGASPREAGEAYELYDLPWALELSSGRKLYGAYWHARFGVEHGPGAVQLSPADAQRLFSWVAPALPQGFHGIEKPGKNEPPTYVVIRK